MIERRKIVKKKNVQAFCDEETFELKKIIPNKKIKIF